MSANLEGNSTQQLNNALVRIAKIEGKVKVLTASSIKKHTAVVGELLFQGDKLITYADSKAVVLTGDNSKLALNENSELTFKDIQTLEQVSGEVYYNIQKRAHSKGLKVETPFSIIGIKGTEFIVVANETDGEIALNEGLIGVESLQADFELHKQKIMQEYEAFKNRQMEEFEAYKAQGQDDVVTYVKAFDLHASKILRFDDASNCKEECESRVNESDFTDKTAKRFKFYQALIQE
jgi:hypothetical protein